MKCFSLYFFCNKVVNSFRRFGLLTIFVVLGLIFVGGFVRASGAGMGCPDWPKCFGMWIPPTSIDQLPLNYQVLFGSKLKGEVIFNPIKTWIEYINRLFGVLTGLFIFLTVVFSYRAYFLSRRSIFYLSFIAFFLVLIEGWLGSKVVSSELHPTMVTIHMVLSLIILGLLILAILKSYLAENMIQEYHNVSDLSFLVIIVLFITTGQIIFGTQIREGIDIAQKSLGEVDRGLWVETIKGKVLFHGFLSMIVFFVQFLIFRRIRLRFKGLFLEKISFRVLIVICFSIVTGGVLGFAGFPALLQPFHMTFSVIIVSLQFVLLFLMKPNMFEK